MGHDDPKNPHHHAHDSHHQPDDVIGAPRAARQPGQTHDHAEAGGHAPHAHDHTHDHAHGGAHSHDHAHAAPTSGSSAPAAERAPGSAGGAPHATTPAAPRVQLPQGAGVGRLLHFDCFAGLAGDMIVAALLDLGVPREPVQRALEGLPLQGYGVGAVERTVHAIAALGFVVKVEAPQPYRTYRAVREMLERAELADGVRGRALATFHALAVAEGKIHRIAPEDVHFHEVGAVDAIVDIVAASAALEWLAPARVSCAPLPMGRGFTKSEHGIIPLPAPAVVELLAGIPTESVPIDGELVTPTGAAIVRANAREFTRWPAMKPVATGFGAGTRTLPDRPNLLRVVLGEPTAERGGGGGGGGTFVVLEANLDDATGELLAHATDALLREGALDAWTQPIGMKKGRAGQMLAALTRAGDAERLARVMMAESPTLGVRLRASERVERPRRSESVETAFGRVEMKVADGDGLPATVKPEDDVVRALARAKGVPVKTVHAAAMAAWWAQRGAG